MLVLLLFLVPDLPHHREQVFEDLENTGTRGNDEHRWKYEKENRKYELDADLAGPLLSFLPAACAQEVGMIAQGFSHARAETIGCTSRVSTLAWLDGSVLGSMFMSGPPTCQAGSSISQ